jgi:hypothetical protein
VASHDLSSSGFDGAGEMRYDYFRADLSFSLRARNKYR